MLLVVPCIVICVYAIYLSFGDTAVVLGSVLQQLLADGLTLLL